MGVSFARPISCSGPERLPIVAVEPRKAINDTLELEEALPPRDGRRGTQPVVALDLVTLAVSSVSNYVLVDLGTWATQTLWIMQRTGFASAMLVGLGAGCATRSAADCLIGSGAGR